MFHLQIHFDKSISNLIGRLFKPLVYLLLNLCMSYLMAMEPVNLAVCAPLKFSIGSEKSEHKKSSDAGTQTL